MECLDMKYLMIVWIDKYIKVCKQRIQKQLDYYKLKWNFESLSIN